MGNEASLQMEMDTNFNAEEIKRLEKRFKKLDLDNSGMLSVEEFMSIPELQQNPLVQRVIDIFDDDGNGEVDFKEFIQGVSQLSVKGDKSSKLKLAFRSVLTYFKNQVHRKHKLFETLVSYDSVVLAWLMETSSKFMADNAPPGSIFDPHKTPPFVTKGNKMLTAGSS